jgi:hypothetical protein
MATQSFTVLLVGKRSGDAAELVDYLKRRGCVVRSAASCDEAAALLRSRKFNLVLSDFLISDGSAYRLMPLLSGTRTSMFISNAVEDGCWWMNAIYEGQDCTREPGMHPSEFKARLNYLLDKLHSRTDRTFETCGIGSRIMRNPAFERHLLVVLLACLAALGIFLFGVFARTQPRLVRSNVPTAPRSRLSYQSKSTRLQTPTTHPPRLGFYVTEKDVTI